MTPLLQKAIDEARRMPEVDQDFIATLILEEIEDDLRWAESFARSPETLETMGKEARRQIAEGLCSSDPW